MKIPQMVMKNLIHFITLKIKKWPKIVKETAQSYQKIAQKWPKTLKSWSKNTQNC